MHTHVKYFKFSIFIWRWHMVYFTSTLPFYMGYNYFIYSILAEILACITLAYRITKFLSMSNYCRGVDNDWLWHFWHSQCWKIGLTNLKNIGGYFKWSLISLFQSYVNISYKFSICSSTVFIIENLWVRNMYQGEWQIIIYICWI